MNAGFILGRSRKRKHYGLSQLIGDCSGGIIAALIALPYGLAMASLMGLPPVLGILTSIVTAPVISILGRNPVLIGGTASATVPFIAAAARQQGLGGAAKVCMVASVIMMAFCVMRLGGYISKVPHAVVSGFSCGIGGMMLISQFDIMFGISSPTGRTSASAFGQLLSFFGHVGEMRFVPLILGVTVIVVATLSARVSPKIPAPLAGVILAIVVARVFGFAEKEVGQLAATIPPFVGFKWEPTDVFSVLPAGFALAFVSSVNILITSRVVEHFQGRHRRMSSLDADAELGAYGIANICAAMFGAPLSVGIPARSLAVVRCGGTTAISNVFHAICLIAILWFGGGFVSHIPIPAIAGVTAWMGLCLLDWSAWRRLPKMSHVDAAAFLVTALAVMSVNAVAAVALGCSLYALRGVYVRYRRPVQETVYTAQ